MCLVIRRSIFLLTSSVQLSAAFALLDRLESFSLRQNDVSGEIPEGIFASASLKAIDLSQNALFGVLPPIPEGSAVEILNLSNNNLSGEIMGSTIANAVNLRSLDLSNNAFNGALPAEIFRLPNLMELNLGLNFFSMAIPTEIADATGLVSLTLGPNQFSGTIPFELASLTNLRTLDISDIPDLSGRLPASLGFFLSNLVEWTISGTQIRGDIPDLVSALTNLEVLNFSGNGFTGDLPESLGSLTRLRKFHNTERVKVYDPLQTNCCWFF